MKRIFAFVLAMVLFVGSIPMAPAYAAETDNAEESELTLTLVEAGTDLDIPDHEALFTAYAENLFYGNGPSFFGTAAGSRLTGDEKVLYDALVPYIKQIAAGQRKSTMIGIGQTVDYEGVTYEADVSATFTGSKITQENLGAVMDALLADLPYELYWYDKVTGVKTFILSGSTVVFAQIKLTVADNYSAGGDYVADTAKTGLAAAAAANAKAIVSKYAAKTDYEKLLGYKQEICDLVSYDHAAADNGNFSLDNDPWQLIHVFDGDPNTNVVCEGYSKAFMYLCDLTTFSGDVACYTVSGDMNGGGHMWNIVTMGGKSYLMDVTNSEIGTVGQDGRFVLAGTAGSAASGYTIGTTTFTYDAETIALWGTGADSILTLEAKNYTPGDEEPEDPCANGHVGKTEARDASAATCTAEGYTGDTYCLTCGNKITSGTIIPKIDHSYTAVVTEPTCAEKGYTTYTCQCGDTYTGNETPVVDHVYEDGKCKWCQKEEPHILFELAGANMTLGNELAMNFFVNKSDIDSNEDYYIKVTKTYAEGRADVVKTFAEDQWGNFGNKYYVTFDGVAAKEMTDKIYVQVFCADGTPASEIWTDSVADYALRIMESKPAKTKTMLVDMLNYGSAAQTKFGYGEDNLASDLLTAAQKAYATQSATTKDYRVKGTNYHGSNLELGNSIILGLFFKNVDTSMYAIATYTDHNGNARTVRIEGSDFDHLTGNIYRVPVRTLAVADARQIVTCNVYKADGTLVGTCQDSMESYINRMSTKDALYEAIMKFAVSAYAYFHY